MTRDVDVSRDAVQETLLRAYRTFDGFAEGTNGKAWLFTILHSVLRNRWRRLEVERRSMDPAAEDTRFDDALASPIPALSWSSGEVDEALARLPAEYREAVLLVDVEELGYDDAAAAAGCPIGTLRSRLHRGRRALYVELESYARRMGLLPRSER
jgi:RNA polymerase sigma-70 factor (ECF subfamily)